MTVPIAAGVLVAALALVMAGWFLRRRRDRRIATPEDVAEAAEQRLTGFRTANAVLGADGTGALAVSNDGRVAAVRRHGGRLSVREVEWSAVRSIAGGIVVDAGEHGARPVVLTGVSVLDIRRLASAPARAGN